MSWVMEMSEEEPQAPEEDSDRKPEERDEGSNQNFKMVPLQLINVPRERVTSVWDPEIEEEFIESIKAKGILEPVSLLDINGALWLIDGLHRVTAAEKLGYTHIPAIVKKGSIEDLLIENIIRNRQRGKSNPAQEAETLAFLVNSRGFPLETAAKQMGLSLSWAKRLLKIAGLPDEVKDYLKHGKIPVTGAFYLADLPNPQDKIQVARDAATYNYTAYQIKARVAQILNPDQEPEQGSYTFTSNGKPQRVPTYCEFCGKALPDVGKTYIWVCDECKMLLHDLYSGYVKALKQYSETQQPQQ